MSPSPTIGIVLFASHIFRMSLFFFVAGFFARMLFHRRGPRGFWLDRTKRILVPLVAGWVVLAPMVIGLWIWGITRSFGGTLPAAPPPMPQPPPGAFPLLHLWFLYYLCLLYGVVVLGRTLVARIDRGGAVRRRVDALVRGSLRSGTAALVLPLPSSRRWPSAPTG